LDIYAWLLAIGDFAAILPVLAAGPLDCVPTRNLFLVAGSIQVIITFSMAPIASFPVAMCYRFLFGLCQALIFSCKMVLVGEQLPPRYHAVFTGILQPLVSLRFC
jgi:MFS family permease